MDPLYQRDVHEAHLETRYGRPCAYPMGDGLYPDPCGENGEHLMPSGLFICDHHYSLMVKDGLLPETDATPKGGE